MKILILTPTFPYPPASGASIRIYNIIKHLSRENEVQLVSFSDGKDQEAEAVMKRYCSKVTLIRPQKLPALLQLPKVLHKFLTGLPFMLKYAESPQLEEVLRGISNGDRFDIVQFEHSYMAHNIRHLPQDLASRTVLSFHNIACAQYFRIYQTERRLLKKMAYLFEWIPMFRWEGKIAGKFHKSLVCSEVDRALLQFLNPMLEVAVVPNGVDAQAFAPCPVDGREPGLVFVGTMDYQPNADAACYFHREIFPLLKKRFPGLRLLVVGSNPPPEVVALSRDPDVVVTGRVDDVMPYYQKAMVAVVPLRSGGGTRLKIVEAMSTGTPVVSTAVGCEGLEVRDGEHLMIANTPAEFSRKVVELLEDREMWLKVSSTARRLVEARYDWELVAGSLQEIYRELLQPEN